MAAIVVKEDAMFCSNRRRVSKSAFKSQTGNNSFRLDGMKKKQLRRVLLWKTHKTVNNLSYLNVLLSWIKVG